MLEELGGYSDHALHQFCASSRNKRLQEMALPVERVCSQLRV